MSEVASEMDGQLISRNVAVRAKALKALRELRHPATLRWTALLISMVVVGIGLSGLHPAFWAKVVLSVACILTFTSVAELWQMRRQLSAISDLLLLSETERD